MNTDTLNSFTIKGLYNILTYSGRRIYALQGAYVPLINPNFPNMREYIKKIMLAWSQGKQHASSGCGCSYSGKQSMTLEGNTIWSYSTPIAHIKDGVMHLNTEKYSATTTRQQSGLINISGQYGLRVVECTKKEVRTLWANS